jgi:hypothetical protein
MIKVNLLPQKRPKMKRGPGVQVADTGTTAMLAGIGSLLAVAALVFFIFDKPKRDELSELEDKISTLDTAMAPKNSKLAGDDKVPPYAELKAAFEAAQARAGEIDRLLATRILPANVLHELGKILSSGDPERSGPTMTDEMIAKTSPNGDPNKRLQQDWDPNHVWLTSYTDTGGAFRMEGGAQTENDVTQLSKRLAASVYFFDVAAARQQLVTDSETGLNYYKFTITGRVAY